MLKSDRTGHFLVSQQMQGLTSYLDTIYPLLNLLLPQGKMTLIANNSLESMWKQDESSPTHTEGAGEIPMQTVASVEEHLRKQHPGVNPDLLGHKPPG